MSSVDRFLLTEVSAGYVVACVLVGATDAVVSSVRQNVGRAAVSGGDRDAVFRGRGSAVIVGGRGDLAEAE